MSKLRIDEKQQIADERAHAAAVRSFVVYWQKANGGRTIYFASHDLAAAERELRRLRRNAPDNFYLGDSTVFFLPERWKQSR